MIIYGYPTSRKPLDQGMFQCPVCGSCGGESYQGAAASPPPASDYRLPDQNDEVWSAVGCPSTATVRRFDILLWN